MTSEAASIEQARRAAWAVLALMLVAALALSAPALSGLARSTQAARRGWSLPVAAAAPSPATVAVATPPVTAAEFAAPGSGSTGTIALPALPALPPLPALLPGAALPLVPADLGITAARAFTVGRAARPDRVRALECLTAAIYYEAAGEPDAGQAAVAQVVLNRVRHPAFPATVCGVVYQGSEKAGCQFSFACDGSMLRRPPAAAGWARAARAAATALAGHVFAPVGLATHYHSFAVTPAWNRSLVMTDMVGAHFFHRWKGWWGTAAAFRQVYAGGEPLPGPHPPLVAPPLDADAAPVIAAAAPVATALAPAPAPALANARPAWRDSGTAVAPAAADTLPPAAAVLPQWRESGRMLR